MNAIGKILVILNFIFAIVVGAILVMDVAYRTKWKEAYDAVVREMQVMKASRDTTQKSIVSVATENDKVQAEISAMKQKLKDVEDVHKVTEDKYTTKINDLTDQLQASGLSVKATLETNKRLADEIALLKENIKAREDLNVKLDADAKGYRIQAVNFEQVAKTRQQQNELLLEQVRELTAALARGAAGLNPDKMIISNANEPNPPPVKVNGRIEQVNTEGSGILVKVDLGTDHGVNKYHTLDVFRLAPKTEWLGMVRIVEAHHHFSIARLVTTGNPALRAQIREGDKVASWITK
jgi:hypothetical protein